MEKPEATEFRPFRAQGHAVIAQGVNGRGSRCVGVMDTPLDAEKVARLLNEDAMRHDGVTK